MVSVNIVDFRNNLSEYLRRAEYKGESIRIVDRKRKKTVAELNPPKEEESWEDYMKFVESMRGVFKDLPEDTNRARMKKAGIKKMKKLREGKL